MSSYSALQTRVQTRLIDLPAAVLAEVPTLINDAIRLLQAVHNFRCMRAEQSYTTNIAATNSHVLGQIPTNWKEPRGNAYYRLQLGSTREILWLPDRAQVYRKWYPFDTNQKGPPRDLLLGEPINDTVGDPNNPDYTASDLNLEVYPYPDGLSDWTTAPAGEYRINIPYWSYLPDLSADTDTNWFTEHATRYVVDMATSMGFALDWDEPRAQFWQAQAIGPKGDWASLLSIGGWARVAMNLDRSLALAPGKVLAPRADVMAPRDSWRT